MGDKLCVCGMSNATVGSVVLHNDHLAAIAAASTYDEEKERALFEAAFGALNLSGEHDSWIGRWKFTEYHVDSLWFGWISCAKSRAKAAGVSDG